MLADAYLLQSVNDLDLASLSIALIFQVFVMQTKGKLAIVKISFLLPIHLLPYLIVSNISIVYLEASVKIFF